MFFFFQIQDSFSIHAFVIRDLNYSSDSDEFVKQCETAFLKFNSAQLRVWQELFCQTGSLEKIWAQKFDSP